MGIVIYALVDPRTNRFRYIGKTIQHLNDRLLSHIHDKAKSHKTNWIASLLKIGLRPQIIPVQICPSDDNSWQQVERYWISFFRAWSSTGLTNHEDGGLGGQRGARKPETIEKMRRAMTGKKHSAETKAKMSLARKGKKHSPSWCANISKALDAKRKSACAPVSNDTAA